MAPQQRRARPASNQSAGGNGGGERRSTTTYTDIKSYDSHFTSLSASLWNNGGMLNLAPIDPKFIGQVPKKGDKVYDHESQLGFFVNAAGAVALRQAINSLRKMAEGYEDTEESAPSEIIRSVVVDLGNEGIGIRRVTVYAPGKVSIKAAGTAAPTSENYVLKFEVERDGEIQIAVHVLQNSEVQYSFTKASGEGDIVETVYTGLELILEFLTAVITTGTAAPKHGAAMVAQPSGGAAQKPFKGNATFDEGDDEAEESEETTTAPRKPGRTAGARTAPRAQVASLAEEFDDDVPQ